MYNFRDMCCASLIILYHAKNIYRLSKSVSTFLSPCVSMLRQTPEVYIKTSLDCDEACRNVVNFNRMIDALFKTSFLWFFLLAFSSVRQAWIDLLIADRTISPHEISYNQELLLFFFFFFKRRFILKYLISFNPLYNKI